MSDGYEVLDAYPADAVGGADFLTAAAQRILVDRDANGEKYRRKERVVVTDRLFVAEDLVRGRACFGEQSVRDLGAAIGLVDAGFANECERRMRGAIAERDQFEAEALAAKEALGAHRFLIYVAADGTEHASREELDRYVRGEPPLPDRSIHPDVEEPVAP